MSAVVWFKRDLRLRDHAALQTAMRHGPVIGLYIYEPELLHSPEFHASHLEFINESLSELSRDLRRIGGKLITRVGEAVEVLERLRQETGLKALYSHMETGNEITFSRDRRVGRWCASRSIPWLEVAQYGIMRGGAPRPHWATNWEDLMRAETIPAPERLETPDLSMETAGILSPAGLHLEPNLKVIQPGGSSAGYDLLETFLTHRGREYQRAMSSPEAGWDACSRLSPHIAFGTVSLREVFQRNLEQFDAYKRADITFARSLQSFNKRLHWHCHFMQKLEDEPEIEFRNQNRAFDRLRESEFDRDRFDAFCAGQTGFPIVDACVRCLLQTGWINFRMRAMLMSFAAHHLWLHWREVGLFLARHFLDFEPGIHWAQVQMQSAVTGTNTIRMYSAVKQARDQDPTGTFIRRWVPELQRVPLPYLHQPETLPPLIHTMLEPNYPPPIVGEREAMKLAKDRLYALKRSAPARLEAERVLERHSRTARRV